MILPRSFLSSIGLVSVLQRDSTTVPALWAFPDGTKADFGQTFYSGQAVNVSWNGGFNKSISDLWVVAYDYGATNSFAQLLTKAVDLTTDGAFTWTIDIPAVQLTVSPRFVLQFKPYAKDYQYMPDSPSLDSRGFLISPASMTPPTTIHTATSSLPSQTSSPLPTPTPTTASGDPGSLTPPESPPPDKGSHLSLAAQAGVATAVVLGVMAAGALAWALARRYRAAHRPPSWPPAGRDRLLRLTIHTGGLVAALSPAASSPSPSPALSLASSGSSSGSSSRYGGPDSPAGSVVGSPVPVEAREVGVGAWTVGHEAPWRHWHRRSEAVELEAESVRWG